MEDSKILEIANKISIPHGLVANFLRGENIMSVGVGGDNRTYTRVIILTGRHPGNDTLADISTQISNLVKINRVVLDITPLIK